jgi:Polysaccharide deacetylase
VLYDVAMIALIVVLVGVVVLAHTAPFPFLLEAFRPSKSLWHVPARPGLPPTLYLTFDDGPNATWTPPLLDALRDTDTRATFFLIDEHITPETAPIVRRIADEGHAIALRPPSASKPSPAGSRAGCSGRTPGGAAARCMPGRPRPAIA